MELLGFHGSTLSRLTKVRTRGQLQLSWQLSGDSRSRLGVMEQACVIWPGLVSVFRRLGGLARVQHGCFAEGLKLRSADQWRCDSSRAAGVASNIIQKLHARRHPYSKAKPDPARKGESYDFRWLERQHSKLQCRSAPLPLCHRSADSF
eukprot:s236_g20.t1